MYQNLYTGKNVETYFLILRTSLLTTLKKFYFCFVVKYTDLMPKIPLYLCQETNLDRVASLSEGWGRGNLHLNDTCTL